MKFQYLNEKRTDCRPFLFSDRIYLFHSLILEGLSFALLESATLSRALPVYGKIPNAVKADPILANKLQTGIFGTEIYVNFISPFGI